MTRLDQALSWWKNQKEGKIYVRTMPIRHRKVLKKHKKIRYNHGINSEVDYYTLSK